MNGQYACGTDGKLNRLAAIVAAGGTPLRVTALKRNLIGAFMSARDCIWSPRMGKKI
jgi:hypothetical protein